ncbi:MAG: DNA (cytosine-5-)-methyltransferase [Clostridia bacterium]|nr:DNA (cytosine-5-)-methyltransferase [Clostridia bacterium]
MKKTVIELFAGVGGFRVGFNNIKSFDKNGKAIENGPWNFVWANQWEPSTKTQHAFDCYNTRFPDATRNSNIDISKVDRTTIPEHSVLCGGFPCQDYSVAHSLKDEKGIEGKKGVLWWDINDILKVKRPPFVLLENVDRLLKAPAKQRGQAFGIILRCFADLGYGVQWRVINAADYGHPQKRRRTFIFAFHSSTKYYKNFEDNIDFAQEDVQEAMLFACFPASLTYSKEDKIVDISKKKYKTVADVSEKFKFDFDNAGYMLDYKMITAKLNAVYDGKTKTLKECLDCKNVPDFCYKTNVKKFEYLKGSKKIERVAANDHKYFYSEGPVPFPDKLNTPARTMLTSEGTVNRSSHLIMDPISKKYRILTPVECERIDEFPDNWTNTGMPDKRRYFMMGNALVTGLIRTIAESLEYFIDKED